MTDVKKDVLPPLPRAIVTIHPQLGVQVKLENWMGVGTNRLEQVYHQLVVAAQRFRAEALQQARIKEKSNVA